MLIQRCALSACDTERIGTLDVCLTQRQPGTLNEVGERSASPGFQSSFISGQSLPQHVFVRIQEYVMEVVRRSFILGESVVCSLVVFRESIRSRSPWKADKANCVQESSWLYDR